MNAGAGADGDFEEGESVDPIDGMVVAAARHATRTSTTHRGSVRPLLATAVVACMDSRIDVFGLLGLDIGDAHILRNAGGIVTDDVIRSLVISRRLLGTRRIVLVHHTDCGLQKTTDGVFAGELESATGLRPSWLAGAFTDPFEDVTRSMHRLRTDPFLLATAPADHEGREGGRWIRGFVYDVSSHELIEVKDED